MSFKKIKWYKYLGENESYFEENFLLLKALLPYQDREVKMKKVMKPA